MCAHLALGDTYDTSALLKMREVPFWQKLLLVLSLPLYIPKIFYTLVTNTVHKNPLHDGIRKLDGIKKAASSGSIKFKDVKDCAKRLNITINDLAMSCLSTSIKQYFISVGDTKTDSIHLGIPASIRFSIYKSIKELKLENKFGPIPLTLPLYEELD